MSQFILGRFKRPSEKFSIGVDFTNDLEAGDSIASKTITAVDAGDGSDATSTFIASSTQNGAVLGAVIMAGTAGHKYRVIFKATTTNGRIYEHEVLVTVDAAG